MRAFPAIDACCRVFSRLAYGSHRQTPRIDVIVAQRATVLKLFSSKYSVCNLEFPQGLDCILSKFRLIKPSLFTNTRAVVEGIPYSNHNEHRNFTRGLPNTKRYYRELGHYPAYCFSFLKKVVVWSLRGFPTL